MTQEDLIELILSPAATAECLKMWESQDLVLTLAAPVKPGYPLVFAVHLNGGETCHRYTVGVSPMGQMPGFITLNVLPEQFKSL